MQLGYNFLGEYIMKIVNLSLASALALGSFAVSTTAHAQNASCTCTAVSGSGALASNVAGDVSYSSATGYSRLTDGTSVPVGSQILFGDGSSATISVGASCNLNVGGNSEVSLYDAGAEVCVEVSNLAVDAPVQEATTPTVGGPAAAIGIAALVGGAVLLFDDDDNPTRP